MYSTQKSRFSKFVVLQMADSVSAGLLSLSIDFYKGEQQGTGLLIDL